MKFNKADMIAIEKRDSNYLTQKGAKYYIAEDYAKAIEYYRLASSMGNVDATSNLGYCYMYGRSIDRNINMAIAYFMAAANKGSVDAMYKLGNIYKHGYDEVEADNELAAYYYQKAVDEVFDECLDPCRYPSLFFSMAKEFMPGGEMCLDYKIAYDFLNHAKVGYEMEKQDGVKFHINALNAVDELLEDPHFDIFKDEEDDYDIDDFFFDNQG